MHRLINGAMLRASMTLPMQVDAVFRRPEATRDYPAPGADNALNGG